MVRQAKGWTACGEHMAVEREFLVAAMSKLILVRHGIPDEGHPLRPYDPPSIRRGKHRRLSNPHVHFQCVVLDGVFESTPAGASSSTRPPGSMRTQAIAAVQAKVRRRLLCSLVRRGLVASNDARDMAQWGQQRRPTG